MSEILNRSKDLLAPIILGELPHELRKNLPRKHDSPE